MSTVQPLEGEVFYPSNDVLSQASPADWDELAQRAGDDLEGFWAAEVEKLAWFRWLKAISPRWTNKQVECIITYLFRQLCPSGRFQAAKMTDK